MDDPHARLHEKLLDDLMVMSQMDIIGEVKELLADSLLEQYEEGLQMDARIEVFGVTHIVAELLLSYFEHEDVAVTHRKVFPTESNLTDMIRSGELSEAETELVESYTERRSEDPQSYRELFELYLSLAGDLLTGLEYRINEGADRDPATDEAVRARLERDGQSFETTLRTTDSEIDVESVLSVLNRVVEVTTTDDRRFSRVEFTSNRAHVFFCTPYQAETLKNYFSFATGEIRDNLESDGDT